MWEMLSTFENGGIKSTMHYRRGTGAINQGIRLDIVSKSWDCISMGVAGAL